MLAREKSSTSTSAQTSSGISTKVCRFICWPSASVSATLSAFMAASALSTTSGTGTKWRRQDLGKPRIKLMHLSRNRPGTNQSKRRSGTRCNKLTGTRRLTPSSGWPGSKWYLSGKTIPCHSSSSGNCASVTSAAACCINRSRGTNKMRSSSRSASRRQDRKSTRLNSSHVAISYAVFCSICPAPDTSLSPYTTLFRSPQADAVVGVARLEMVFKWEDHSLPFQLVGELRFSNIRRRVLHQPLAGHKQNALVVALRFAAPLIKARPTDHAGGNALVVKGVELIVVHQNIPAPGLGFQIIQLFNQLLVVSEKCGDIMVLLGRSTLGPIGLSDVLPSPR